MIQWYLGDNGQEENRCPKHNKTASSNSEAWRRCKMSINTRTFLLQSYAISLLSFSYKVSTPKHAHLLLASLVPAQTASNSWIFTHCKIFLITVHNLQHLSACSDTTCTNVRKMILLVPIVSSEVQWLSGLAHGIKWSGIRAGWQVLQVVDCYEKKFAVCENPGIGSSLCRHQWSKK